MCDANPRRGSGADSMLNGKNYQITKKNILAHEFIGLNAVVSTSSDKSRNGMQGLVIDETKSIIVLETKNGEKKIPKKEAMFEFVLGDEKAMVDGKKIVFRPEDRVKVFWRNN